MTNNKTVRAQVRSLITGEYVWMNVIQKEPMTAPDVNADVRACPFCGNAKMEIHHSSQAGITFLLCGDDVGKGGCGAVVSFRPNLTGSKMVQAYNTRAAHADLAGEVRELVEADREYDEALTALEDSGDDVRWEEAIKRRSAALAKSHPTHQETNNG